MNERNLIVGLGNPGREYENTRHNIGFRVVDALAARHKLVFDKKQGRALCADGLIAGRRVLLVKPMTYMNLSGESVSSLLSFYKLPLSALMVVSDDMDVPLGTLRIRQTGSAGGQNGLRSIIQHVGGMDFARMRFGIGRPPGRMAASAYVLQDFGKDEADLLAETMDRAVAALEMWLTSGIDIMMNRFNGNGQPPPPKPPRPPAPPEGSRTAPNSAQPSEQPQRQPHAAQAE